MDDIIAVTRYTKIRRTLVWLAAVGLATSACGSGEESSADVAQSRLVVEQRIGAEGQGHEYEFTTISQVSVHRDTVFVVQNGLPEIRAFGSDGRYIRTIGTSGSGPGEFISAPTIGFLGDTLWAIDADGRRISYYTSTGSLLSTVHLPPIPLTLGQKGQLYFPYPKALTKAGWIFGFGGEAGSSLVKGLVKTRPLLRFGSSSVSVDTLGWVSIEHADMVIRTDRRASLRSQPFTDAPLFAFAPSAERVVVVERLSAMDDTLSAVRVITLNVSGDTVWSTQLPYKPARLENTIADSVRASLHRAYAPRYPREAIDRALFIARFRTPITAVIAGEDGTVWLRWDAATAANLLTVIDANGKRRADVVASTSIGMKWVSATTVWGEELDADDVPSLVRYRLVDARKQ